MPTRVECQAWPQPVLTTSLSDILSGDAFLTPPRLTETNGRRWIVPIPEENALLQSCVDRLTDAEKERAERFRHEGARKQFIVGHGALHSILEAYLGEAYDSVHWMETEHHKPFILFPDSSKPLEFNLSHCDGYIALAVGKHSQGIDIEKHRHLDDLKGISRQVFTNNEMDQVFASQESETHHQLFFRFWTCKEAALKANGTGFLKDPKSLELDFSTKPESALETVFWNAFPGYNLAWTQRA